MMTKPHINPLNKRIRLYISTPQHILNSFPSPLHARLFVENCLQNFNPNINTIPKPSKLNNFNANKALQKFIKNSNNPQI